MKRLLTLLIILALVGYLTFKGGVWWLADQQFAAADEAVDEVGVIDHGSIRSGISGTLTLMDGGYEDFRLSQPLKFGRLSFDAGSPIALVNVLLDPSALPMQWSLDGEQLSMALDEALLRDWVTATNEVQDPTLFAPVCGPDHRQQLGSGDLLRLGITGLTGEALIRQNASELYAEVTTVETGSIEVLWPGARFDLMNPTDVFSSSTQPVTLNIRDGGLMRRISAYCAREAGLEAGEWTRVVMKSFRQALATRGYRPSDQLIALYRQWLAEGGELSIELAPGQPLWGVPLLAAEAGENRTVEPFITYNGAGVPDVFLTPIAPEPEEVPAEAMEPVVDESDPAEPGWQLAATDDASALIGQTVRVTLENGNVVEGRLGSVNDKRMEVVRLVDGGEVAYPIAIRLITRFEIWRRGQNP
ncbi:acetylornithine deacetylase [Marinobacter sp. CHS3-4]|uniref:acetylornithine deacetylase n=1 Tax=Marinobacter sp. CHS3-4 TaxID=3045174 RepID=UPI0024B5A05E|nr:acetylornithine deacetylase [Marinobacter sp. CHS3-4]MDI9244125.1 acetylornithine deacetylase [Marinobacter sp. CHS3-4]